MLTALTRPVSSTMTDCALTYLDRQPIDLDRAVAQHRDYQDCLRRLGVEVVELPPQPELPDAVFVEDTAVVLDDIAVITSPRLPSRRSEVDSTARALAQWRPLLRLDGASRLEGGDVVRIGSTLYIGHSSRTNSEGIEAMRQLLVPRGYEVRAIAVEKCLHLKTACTYIGRDTLLVNPDWVDTVEFEGVRVIEVDPDELEGGNALLAGDTVMVPANCPRTRARIEHEGFSVVAVDISELQKAEAGLTCCSIVFRIIRGRHPPAPRRSLVAP
jgi:dimethylargininase